MIRKLCRLTLTWLAVWTFALGFNQMAEAQQGHPASFSLDCPATVPSGGQLWVFLRDWVDYDLLVNEDGSSETDFDLVAVDWTSDMGEITGYSYYTDQYAVLTAPIVDSDTTLVLTCSATDSRSSPQTPSRSAVVTVLGRPRIALEINQRGPQDNYLALSGTGALSVSVSGGDSGTNYTVALSCAGSGSPSGSVALSSTSVTVAGGGGTQTLSLSGAAPGYFSITGTASNAATGTVGGAVVQVDIKRNGATITGLTTSVMVGQHIELTGVTQPGLTGSWSVPGTLVKSYTYSQVSAGTAGLSSVDLSGGAVGYYWIDGGTAGQVVTYSASAGSLWFSASTTFNVQLPDSTLVCVTTSNTPAVNCADSAGLLHEPCLHFGSMVPRALGISWTGSVTTPPSGSGDIQFTQLVDTDREQTLVDGTPQVLSLPAGYLLDGATPYGNTMPIGSSDKKTIPDDDTPESGLAGTTHKSVRDKYHLYLQYRPNGTDSIWVTLREVRWKWRGSCTLNAGSWSMDATGTYYTANPGSFPSTTLPTWPCNVTSAQWVNKK